MSIKLLTKQHLEFLSLKGSCTRSSEPTPVKMPHCWKSHVTAQLIKVMCVIVLLIILSIQRRITLMLRSLRLCACWDSSNSYTMGCPPVRGDNPRALASGLSYVQVDKHGITILYHLHQCIPCHIMRYFMLKLVKVV